MREYRQDSHTWPLAAWTVLCVLTAVSFFAYAGGIDDRGLGFGLVAAGAGLLVIGPVVLVVYLYRARHVWVGVDVPQGVVVSGRHVIPWEAIVRVERRRPRLRRTSGPAQPAEMAEVSEGCFAAADDIAALFLVVVLLSLTLLVAWLIWGVLISLLVVPLLEVFAPFGDRIRIVTTAGRPLVLRDLRGADEFMSKLPRGIQAEC